MKVVWVINLVLISTLVQAQRRPTDKIYWTALEKYTIALDSNNTGNKIIYLEQRGRYIDSIPKLVNGYHIIPLTDTNIFKIYKEHNNHLIQTYISPVEVQDGMMKIVFIPFGGRLKGRNFNLSNGGGTAVYFKWDNITQRFVFDRTESHGI